jgi:hypothetical protein
MVRDGRCRVGLGQVEQSGVAFDQLVDVPRVSLSAPGQNALDYQVEEVLVDRLTFDPVTPAVVSATAAAAEPCRQRCRAPARRGSGGDDFRAGGRQRDQRDALAGDRAQQR